MSQKLLVIGSNSFSGSHFAARASHLGYEVLGISRSDQPNKFFLPETWDTDLKKSYKFRKVDLHHREEVNRVVSLFNPNFVVNFAAQGMVAESWEAPIDWYQTNLIAQIELHQTLRALDGLIKYVHVTTPEVYGSTPDWIEEDQEFNPSTPYAASRAACDLHLRTFFSGLKFPVVFTRSANVYGPGQQLYRVVPRAILSCVSGMKLPLHGNGESTRSLLHVDDMVDATLAICENGSLGQTYHISDQELISISGLVEKIAKKFGMSLEQVAERSQDRLGKDASYRLSSKKLRTELNWSPKRTLNDGLSQTISWVQKYYPDLKTHPWTYIHKK